MIEGFCGLIGAGKTMLAVRHVLDLARRRGGALVVSNIRITDPTGAVECRQLGVGHDGIELDELQALIDEHGGEHGRGLVLLLDEIGVLCPARFWQTFPIDLMCQFSQSRKNGLDVVFTSQDVEMVDAMVRRLTQWIYLVRAIPGSSIERTEKGKRPWFFVVTRWRPATVGKRDKRLGRELIRYRRAWELAYNTWELVKPAARLIEQAETRRCRSSTRRDRRSSRGTSSSPEAGTGVGRAAACSRDRPG